MRSRPAIGLLVVCSLAVLAAPVGGVAIGDTGVTSETSVVAQSGNSVSDVSVAETPIEAGETATVTAVVANDGDEVAEFDVTVTLDGTEQATETVTIDPDHPTLVTFEFAVDEPGTYTVAVDGVEADQELTVEEANGDSGADDADDSDGADDSDDDADGTPEGVVQVDAEEITVESVGLDPSTATVGETVLVTANLTNSGEQRLDVEIDLEIDGEVVETAVAEEILHEEEFPGAVTPFTFEYEPEETGTFTVSVSDTEADEQLTVEEAEEEADDDGLFSFLGFLPLGILRLIAIFVVLPIALIYLVLKALAIYLGY